MRSTGQRFDQAGRGDGASEPRQPAEAGQRPAMTLSGPTQGPGPGVPAAATTTPARTARGTTCGVAQHRRRRDSRRRPAQVRVNGSRRWRATTTSAAGGEQRHTASPTLRAGQVRAAEAPTPREPEPPTAGRGRRARARSRREPRRSSRAPRRAKRAAVPPTPRTRGVAGAGGGRRRGLVGGWSVRHGPLLAEVRWVGRRGRPGQDGAQGAPVVPWGSAGLDGAAVQVADPARDGEAEAGTAAAVESPPGSERVEDPLAVGRRGRRAPGRAPRATSVLVDGAGDRPARRPGAGCAGPRCRAGWRRAGAAGPGRRHDEVGRARPVAHQTGRAADARPPATALRAAADPHRVEGQGPRRRRPGTGRAGPRPGGSSRSAWVRAARRASSSGRPTPSTRFSSRAAQGGQRGAQLVADVGDQLAALPVDGGEVRGHRVERAASSPTSSAEVAVTRRA